ncbi:ESPR-type extended signal peptide-containing protein [Dialister invisus]|uniref:ESPR-type extended signal peptide-containing protein n=1 Tax=Dialister invisus TaxID=218538 RepID=UPI0027BA1390|nr:ESPR-type extended signal peptide-containing protein [Dialister invisus]
MNHIYKVIWSRVKNSCVVVSEIAGTARKSGGVRVSKNALAAALTAFLLTSSVAGAVDNVIVGNTEAPNAVTDTTDSTVVGIENKVSKEKDDVIVGKKNTIEDSEDVRVVGKGNTVTNSDRQNVIGDNNSITNRDAGTVSGYHGITRNGTSDLVIGMGNKIEGNDTYMTGHESLTIIGNNNETVNPTSGIVIGDNQTFGTIKESVIIGSMTPEEKASGKREQGGGSVVVGYNAQSGRGLNVAVGHSALALGHEGTVTGHNSVIEANQGSFPNIWSSIYGVNNKITSNGNTSNGIAGSIIGAWNKLDNADNSMIFGSGNILSHATVDMSSGLEGNFGQGSMSELLFRSGYQEGYSDQAAKVMGDFANTSGSVLIAGNGNRSDYARRSQIIGTGNILNGTANGTSANNTMAGFQNTGTNVNRVAVVGTGNKISDGISDVVIGDYHEMSGGTNNVILGAMATKEDVVSKTYTPSLGSSSGAPGGYTGRPIPYNVRATVPTKTHTANVSNAVMLGYNTDVQKNGGVALGSESVSSVDAGVYGYSPDTNQNIQNDTEIANLTGKTARLAQLNGDLPSLSSAYTAKKADYEGKVTDFLAKSAEYTQAYQTYHSYEHSGDQYDLARKKKMDDAKIVMDTAQTAMNSAKADYTDAETKYNSALGERNLIIGTWKATAAAVSVGDVSRGITRQITGVAAGTQDTDAVNVAQLKTVNTKYDTKLSRGFIIKKGGEAVGETISLNGDTAPEITFDVAEANKGLTVDRDGKTIKYGIDGSKIDLNGNDTIPGWTLEVGVKPGIPTNTGSAEGNKKVIKPNDTVTLRADNGIRLKQENGVVDIGLKYMAVDTKWTNINDAVATNGGMAIGANSNADGETSVALGWGSNISASNYAAALSPFSSAVNSEYGLAMGTKAAVKTSPYGMAMGALSSVDDSEYGAAIGANSAIVNSNYGVVIGTSATVKDADNAVAIGVSSSAAVKNGVAIGAFSKADTAAGVSGYDPSTKAASADTSAAWRSTVSAASVGDKAKGYTRQITGVAAGTQDTDAVNVAQLKALENKTAAEAAKHTTVTAGDYVTVTETDNSGQKNYTVTGPKVGSADGTVKITDKVENGKKVGYNLSVDTSKLGIKDMHVKEGTATYQADGTGSIELTHQDGQKATVTGLKDTRLKEGTGALTLSGNTLSMKIEDTSGKKVTGSVDLSAIAGQIDTNTTYTMSGKQNADNTTTITLKGSDGKENKVTVATKDTRNTVKAGENVTLATAANTFGGTEYTVNVKADGKVENGNTKIVSGNTVYHETHVKNDGNYVKKENSAGDNLTILDKQVGKNTTNITNLGNTINNLNGKLGTLDNRISKVGAGAAALAALHPLDFDPHDKWDIAAGFGNYRNASAAAVGLFYRPNERTMMSLGWTMGDDRNMINAGVSVKLGRGDVYTRYSKVEMANRIEAQNKRINDMESELEELKAQIAALAAKK